MVYLLDSRSVKDRTIPSFVASRSRTGGQLKNKRISCNQFLEEITRHFEIVFMPSWPLIFPNFTNNMLDSVADLEAEGPCPPPRPVKIGHKKDGHRRRLRRFHVSRPPLPGPWIRYCKFYDKSCKANSCAKNQQIMLNCCMFLWIRE